MQSAEAVMTEVCGSSPMRQVPLIDQCLTRHLPSSQHVCMSALAATLHEGEVPEAEVAHGCRLPRAAPS
jgi:hypothetical protein